MSRSAPPLIQPIVNAGIRYEAPWRDRGILIAIDVTTGMEMWRLLLADYWVDERVEIDVQEIYLKSMQLMSAGQQMLVEDEAGVRYTVDLRRKTFEILNWRADLKILGWRPNETGWRYWVTLSLRNSLNHVLLLDRVSVAAGGQVHNDLFNVSVDGKQVDYRGSVMKRAPPAPSDFVVVQPGETYTVTVELSELYNVPPGEHRVSIAFEHTNHFSPNGFRMTSAPDTQLFSDRYQSL